VVEKPINQRIKFLLEALNLSARDFSRAVGVADNNTQNYLEPRFAQPKAEYLEKVMLHFGSINPIWLLTGQGEPFLGEALATDSTTITNNKTKGNIQNNTGKNATVNNHVTLDDCKRSLETSQREVEQLKALLAAKDDLIAAKEEMLSLLRAGHNRSN
jgi:transcriptional regulator with XRE-family HTH domain